MIKRFLSFLCCLTLFLGLISPTTAFAIVDWPSSVSISADGGIVMDANSGAILYGKNIHEPYYPASITKILTALIIIENCNLDDMVTFSYNAVNNLEPNATIVGARAGDTLSVRDCLYALLLQSANEVANALAEHCSGDIESFAELMNRKAESLGCTDSHFANPSGLNNENHYTSAHDMALIAQAAFNNPTFVEIDSTTYYDVQPGQLVQYPDGWRYYAHHRMLRKNDSLYYDGIIGGKTGYTSLAGNTLVTCAERDGLKLITVVLNGHQTHYEDTKAMLDYGYALAAAGQLNGQAGSQVSGQTGTQTSAAQTGWIEDGSVWRYRQADGSYLASGLYEIGGVVYGFNDSGVMVTGWQKFGGEWRYFKSSGAMAVSCWQQDAGKWFYLGTDGKIVKNALIDNQYYVGADGVWVQ